MAAPRLLGPPARARAWGWTGSTVFRRDARAGWRPRAGQRHPSVPGTVRRRKMEWCVESDRTAGRGEEGVLAGYFWSAAATYLLSDLGAFGVALCKMGT